MSQRNSSMKCFLCQVNAATKTNSHLLPASLVATMVGGRDKEEAYTISPGAEQPVKKYFGRGNLKNTNPEPQSDENIVDFYFCPDCENRFGVIESEINPVLVSKIKDANQKQNFPIANLDSGVSYIMCAKANPTIFRLYIFSLIWRMCLKYFYKVNQEFLASPKEMEWFRRILDTSLGNTIEETLAKGNVAEIERLSFVSFGCIEEYNRTSNVGLLHPNYRYPYCLICNDYLFLFDFTNDQLNSGSQLIKLKDFKIDKRIINLSGPVKIALSKLDYWKLFLKSIWQQSAGDTTQFYSNKLSKKIGVSYKEAGNMIHQKAKEIEEKTGKGYFDCFYEAFNFYYDQ